MTCYHFTLLALVGRLVQIQVILFALYNIGFRLLQNSQEQGQTNGEKKGSGIASSHPKLFSHASLSDKLNSAVHYYMKILRCEDIAATFKFFCAVSVLSWLGSKFSGLNMLYIGNKENQWMAGGRREP